MKRRARVPGTLRRRQVLDAFERLTYELGRPPTVRELLRPLGVNSISTVHLHLQGLARDGCLDYTSGKRTAPYVLPGWRDEVTRLRERVAELEAEVARLRGAA